jgi:hypothetical protein
MRLNKIPLAQFINILEEIYNSGANFVDIVGFPDSDSEELKDIIKLVIRPDYLADDDDEEEGEDITGYIMNEDDDHDKLSEEDISDLI